MRNFDGVPVEDDTVIRLSAPGKLGELDMLYQAWSWDGIDGESFIFHTADVNHLTDSELQALAAASPAVKDKESMTLSRGDEFTFVNFNFSSD